MYVEVESSSLPQHNLLFFIECLKKKIFFNFAQENQQTLTPPRIRFVHNT